MTQEFPWHSNARWRATSPKSNAPRASSPATCKLLIEIVSRACQAISIAIGKGGLGGVLGEAGSDNVQGEAQKKLDVLSNDILLDANEWGGHLAAMASEEMDLPHLVPHRFPKGEYLLTFDPLDGSSNIDVNVSIGTIFSVLKCPEGADLSTPEAAEQAFLQPGTAQVAAGYAVYGPTTLLVLTVGDGVVVFTLDRETGTVRPDPGKRADSQPTPRNSPSTCRTSASGKPPVQRYVDEMQAGKEGPRGKDYNMRWVASMVADVHRILTRGGIFMYPMDSKRKDKGGKLRLMYEANPMAMLVEQAGGAATTGRQRILDIQPGSLHQRVPVILGSKNEVERVTGYHAA